MSSSGDWSAQAPAAAPGPASATASATPSATSTAAPSATAPPPPATGTTVAPPPRAAATNAPAQTPARLGAADVPGALTRWQAVLTVAVLVWALLTAALLANSLDKTRLGASNTEQLTRVHAITSSLFQADAIATNAFLVGGLEPVEQREAYDAALEQVSTLVIEAAEAQPADRAALVALNGQVLHYAEQMQQARANNRQGLPVGAQYLREASNDLRTHTVTVLDALLDANLERAEGSLSGHSWLLVALPGIALLLAIGWFNQQLAALFRRRINVGLVAGAAVVAVMTLGSALVVASLAADADALRDGSFAEAASIAQARTAGNDAKSNESLRLIARGSGDQYEERWAAADTVVAENIADHEDLQILWEAYREGHAAIVEADERGDWDEAVRLAVSTEADSASFHFAAFDEEASAQVGQAGKAVSSVLQQGTWRAAIAAILTVLATGAVLAAVSWGLAVRRKEFG